jgi:dTDP-glucose 4,6-dehydratase
VTILVTGGAGFIGSNFIIDWLAAGLDPVVNLDKLTYAGNPLNLAGLPAGRHRLVEGDIGDRALVSRILEEHGPRLVVNFAAESHVDRSIGAPGDFIATNVAGTFSLLEAVRGHLAARPGQEGFRLLHVSTDEVYGALGPGDPPFTELSPYAPSSPYSASKAAADHLVRAWGRTYGLPAMITCCSNNYGPRQFPEKLIPLAITNALEGRPIPVYGDGLHERDWLHVSDHVRALRAVLERGTPGRTYNIGGGASIPNIGVVRSVCAAVDELAPSGAPRAALPTPVPDRPGHDRRYAVDGSRIAAELGFRPEVGFGEGLRATVEWYLGNLGWVAAVRDGRYRRQGLERPGP